MILRDYQIACRDAALGALDSDRSALIVMPTGTGKTQDFLSVAEEYLERFPRKQVLVIAHREELIYQPAKRWRSDFGGSWPVIEMGDLPTDVPFEVANEVVDMIASNGWQPLQGEQLEKALELCGASDAYEPTQEEEILRRATSWTGSERQRKPQGLCLPPSRPTNSMPRYFIPAGTPISTTKVSPLSWRPHVTKRDLGFERHEGYHAGKYTFREAGFLIEVSARAVMHREDTYGKPPALKTFPDGRVA